MFRIVYIYQDSEDNYVELCPGEFETEQDAKIFILQSPMTGVLMLEDSKLNAEKKTLTSEDKELQEYIEEQLPRYSVIEIHNTTTYEVNDFSEEELKTACDKAIQAVGNYNTRCKEYVNKIMKGDKNAHF
jgi:hypothetical protein